MEENAVCLSLFYFLWPLALSIRVLVTFFLPLNIWSFTYKDKTPACTCKTPSEVCLLCQSLFLTLPWVNCSGKQSCLASAQCHSWAAGGGHSSLLSIREGKKSQLACTQDTFRQHWLKAYCGAWSISKMKTSPPRREGGKEMEMRN